MALAHAWTLKSSISAETQGGQTWGKRGEVGGYALGFEASSAQLGKNAYFHSSVGFVLYGVNVIRNSQSKEKYFLQLLFLLIFNHILYHCSTCN